MTIVILLILLLIFYALQFSVVDKFWQEKKIQSLDLVVMGLAFVVMEFMKSKVDVQYVDWAYSITWPLSLDSGKAMFIFAFFALAFKTIQVNRWFTSASLFKGLGLLVVLVISTIIPSPLLIALLLLVILSVLHSTKIERVALMSLPFLVVIFEIFSVTPEGGLAQLSPLIGETLYGHLGVSALMQLLFLSSILILASQKSLEKPSVVICLGVYLNLMFSLTPHLSSGALFSNMILLCLALWFFLSLRLNAVLPLGFDLKKQTIFLVMLFFLVGQSSSHADEVIRLISLFIFMNMVLSEHLEAPSGRSLFRLLSHSISLLIVSAVLPINMVQLLIDNSFDSTAWSFAATALLSVLVTLVTLRAYSYQKYELKSEHLLNFTEMGATVVSFIFLVLNSIILYTTLGKTSLSDWSTLILCLPSVAVIIASLAGYHAKLDHLCSVLFICSPLDHTTKALSAFHGGLMMITSVGIAIKVVASILLDALSTLVQYLSYICQVSLDWSLRHKTQFLFIVLAATMSVVTGWAL